MKKQKHYVNNKDFYNALVEYKNECNKAEKKWLKSFKDQKASLISEGLSEKQVMKELPDIPYPKIPDYIGECVFQIAEGLAKRPNFFGYSFKDEMVADGYEDCILRIKSFDPEKSKNPFAYFTQTCWYAAIRRIKKEAKQQDVKSAMVNNSNIIHTMEANVQSGDTGVYENSFLEFLKENSGHIETDAEKAATPVIKHTTKKYQKSLLVDEDVRLSSTKEYFAEIENEENQDD